ncbi:MAG: extracellular solute-binding protein [Alphaproteobacteria bacterium]|nr:extracellular solute-binding protein [Alphaproteobacteria bacterium]
MKAYRTGLLALALSVAAGAALAAAPAPSPLTPQLIEAAKKEGVVHFYTAVDLQLAEVVAKQFEQKYPGIKVVVERNGSERLFQRIGQEVTANIHNCDVVNTSDAAHFVRWKKDKLLTPYVTPDIADNFAADQRDPEGYYANWRNTLSPIFVNTKLVSEAETPKSFKDLLDPKWAGKLTKAHPGYSGVVMTATFQVSTALGWGYFEQLAKQKPMQLQSATDPPRKVSAGEREVAVDGTEYLAFTLIEKGNPLKIVYPSEGTPMITSPAAVMAKAPHPNAARVFYHYIHTLEAQQMLVDQGGLRSVHKQVKEPSGRVPLSKIKLLPEDAVAVEREAEAIKRRYRQIFGT